MDLGETLEVSDRSQWRAWLRKHHRSAPEIWLVFQARAAGKSGISYNDAVDEALCFGWIDSIVKKTGPTSRAQRFTPRRPGSALSEMNKVRVRRLLEQKRMTKAGLAAIDTTVLDEPFAIADDILLALRADDDTWRNWQAFPESYRRIRAGFVEAARNRPAMFESRLAHLLKMTKANRRFGMVQ